MKVILSSLMLLISGYLFSQQASCKIEISNLESSDGSVIISVFKDQKGFEDETPVKRMSFSKKENTNGKTFTAELTLPPGTYGLALVDDANNDGEMNFNWVGMPEEGFGFSNYYHTGLSRPEFSDFAFKLKEGKTVLKTKIRYL